MKRQFDKNSGKSSLIVLLIFSIIFFSFSLSTAQKREFRAAWTASFFNLDFPSSRNLTAAQQKNELISLLDNLEALNINALLFQVRPECDALYNSSIEPWSYWLTGTQGIAPSPAYDPLEFVIEEAHKRGIELHAWLNPYRAEANINRFPLALNHVVNQHPDWILTFNSISLRMLDPGKTAVRNYLISIVSDIVTRYDVDGIVFDDYFYPYPNSSAGFSGITNEDAATFAGEPRGFSNIADWRRDNVNLLIANVNSAIKNIKPFVKFGVSPFGIWKNGVPAGIVGLDAYSTIYCDAVAWLNSQSLDYISPQLYWQHGGSQDYSSLMQWWTSQTNSRHLYVSHALSKSASWASDEIPNQIELNRLTSDCDGSIFFRSEYFDIDPHGIVNTLQTNHYLNSALPPEMSWLGGTSPSAPLNLQVTSIYNGNMLSWNLPSVTDPKYIIIYRDETSPIDKTDPANIVDIVPFNQTYLNDVNAINNNTYYYCAVSLNKYDIESPASIEIVSNTNLNFSLLDDFESSVGHFDKPPSYSGSTSGISSSSSAVRVTSGTLNESNGALEVVLKDDPASSGDWFVRLLSGTGVVGNNIPVDQNYNIGYWLKTEDAPVGAQISLLIRDQGALEKAQPIDVINDGYWHLYKWDLKESSQWTSFTGNGQIDGDPVTLDAIVFTAPNASPDWTILLDDVHADELIPLPVELISFEAEFINGTVSLYWHTAVEINNYGFSVERSKDQQQWSKVAFVEGHGNSNSIKNYSVSDAAELNGTVYYRLKQIDNNGEFEYSKTISVLVEPPVQFALKQNFPNPFNPSTTIEFYLPYQTEVSLKVYNILGETVATLINEEMQPGNHKVSFNAGLRNSQVSSYSNDGRSIASGIYIYRIETVNFSKSMKMTLLK